MTMTPLIWFQWQYRNSMDLHLLLYIIFIQDAKNIQIFDSIFQLTMDESLKGNSITVANDDLETPPS